MPFSLEQYSTDLFQDVQTAADAGGMLVEDAFFELFCRHLMEAGELDAADRAHYSSARGLRVDGFGGDPAQSAGTLSLVISDFHYNPTIAKMTATEMGAIFKRLNNFLGKSFDPQFRNSLEEVTAAFGLADLIATRWHHITKVRLFLITNRVLSARVDGRKADEVDGKPVTYSVWDLERLHRFVAAGGREEVEIDLEKELGGGLAALPAHFNQAGYESFLVVVPGKQIAAIYDRWGARLLEQNVRVFLQARAAVNKGIKNTIEQEPHMFFAFNNGITATASSVTSVHRNGQLVITGLKDLQIVNGGQTTASIHAASRKRTDLSQVFVQMKLSIVPPETYEAVVPRISEYANTQNKVNAADFFSNHPFHVRMEEFSRRIYAPSPDGTFRESKWFYERARGQYYDQRARLSGSQRTQFELEFPKSQVFSKTDLAKYLMVWRCQPDVVSKGAQKNFAVFAGHVGKEWIKDSDVFNERYYRHMIAKAITFRRAEKMVSTQPWYQGGYRANVVAYAIAKIAHDVDQMQQVVDFDAIWKAQSISVQFMEALRVASVAAFSVLTKPPSTCSNVSEWAKMPACWARLSQLEVDFPASWFRELISTDQNLRRENAAAGDQRELNGIQAQELVVRAGATLWTNVHDWGAERHLLTERELGILQTAARIPDVIPSDRQSIVAIEALRRLQTEGCPYHIGS